MLEYGLFVGELGRDNVVIVTRDNVKLPSDVRGISYAKKNYITTICKKFKRNRSKKLIHDFHIFSDRILSLESSGIPPLQWASRSLYIGDKGALYSMS